MYVTRFSWLLNAKVEYVSRSRVNRVGRYLFTLDWASPDGQGTAELPGQHKCGHVLELEDGNYAVQPNNRLRAFNPSFTTKWDRFPLVERLLSDRIYTVEQYPKWATSDDERYDYELGSD